MCGGCSHRAWERTIEREREIERDSERERERGRGRDRERQHSVTLQENMPKVRHLSCSASGTGRGKLCQPLPIESPGSSRAARQVEAHNACRVHGCFIQQSPYATTTKSPHFYAHPHSNTHTHTHTHTS